MVATIFTQFWLLWKAISARGIQLVCLQSRRCVAPSICRTRRLIPDKTPHFAHMAEHAVRGEECRGEAMVRSRRDTEPATLARLALDNMMVSFAQQASMLLGTSVNQCMLSPSTISDTFSTLGARYHGPGECLLQSSDSYDLWSAASCLAVVAVPIEIPNTVQGRQHQHGVPA